MPAGRRVGRFVIEAHLGGGAVGDVYRARDEPATGGGGGSGEPEGRRRVALKVLRPDVVADEVLRARFLREARVPSRFRHPAVVEAAESGEADGVCYIAMELVAGETLAEVLRAGGPLAPPRAACVFDQLLAALAAAHEAGVIHRDLKPSNVMLGAGDRVKVLDFGIARFLRRAAPGAGAAGGGEADASSTGLTAQGEFVGTLAYAAPEQVRGSVVDGRTDLYQVGVVLFEALAGRLPFDAGSARELAVMHLATEPPRLASLRPGAGDALDALVARALAKRPEDRFQTAADMRAALAEATAATACPVARLSIGRGRANDVVLAGKRISKTHVVIEVDASGTRARVEGSGRWGTALDGRRLPKGRAVPLPDRFELDLAAGAVRFVGRIARDAASGAVELVSLDLVGSDGRAYELRVPSP